MAREDRGSELIECTVASCEANRTAPPMPAAAVIVAVEYIYRVNAGGALPWGPFRRHRINQVRRRVSKLLSTPLAFDRRWRSCCGGSLPGLALSWPIEISWRKKW